MKMNREELDAKIRDAGFSLEAFTLFEEPREETFCMHEAGTGWVVFYSERGLRANEKFFITEDAACDYFFRELSSWFMPK
jgi:hypothetical protein